MKKVRLDTLKLGDSFIHDGDELILGRAICDLNGNYNCWVRNGGYRTICNETAIVEIEDKESDDDEINEEILSAINTIVDTIADRVADGFLRATALGPYQDPMVSNYDINYTGIARDTDGRCDVDRGADNRDVHNLDDTEHPKPERTQNG